MSTSKRDSVLIANGLSSTEITHIDYINNPEKASSNVWGYLGAVSPLSDIVLSVMFHRNPPMDGAHIESILTKTSPKN